MLPSAALQVGDPFEDGMEQGPQVDQDQLNKVGRGWG
jgi:hypothetical protein